MAADREHVGKRERDSERNGDQPCDAGPAAGLPFHMTGGVQSGVMKDRRRDAGSNRGSIPHSPENP